MKIGLWHEGLVGEDLQTNESSFSVYASEYVKFVTDNNIDRAFFISIHRKTHKSLVCGM
jgi:hypothetical protein